MTSNIQYRVSRRNFLVRSAAGVTAGLTAGVASSTMPEAGALNEETPMSESSCGHSEFLANDVIRNAQSGNLKAAPGEKVTGFLDVPGTAVRMPLTLINGANTGMTLSITAGIHGGEYPSIEAAIRLAAMLDPRELSGLIVVMPLVSTQAFRGTRPRHVTRKSAT